MRRISKSLSLAALSLLLTAPLQARPLSTAPAWETLLARVWALFASPVAAKNTSTPEGELRGGVDPDGLRGNLDPDGAS